MDPRELLFEESIANPLFWEFSEEPATTYSKVDSLAFGILSPTEIRDISVGEITTATLEEKGYPRTGGPNDLRAGTMSRTHLCETCSMDSLNCQGHPMHLELPLPILNITMAQMVLRVLQCLCFGCVDLRADDAYVENLFAVHGASLWQSHHIRRLNTISAALKKRKRCLRCGATCPDISLLGITLQWTFSPKDVVQLAENLAEDANTFIAPGLDLHSATRQKLTIEPAFARAVLLAVPDRALRLLGLDPETAHPANAIFECLLIPPPCVRPAVRYSESAKHRSEHDFTTWIQEIVRAKARLVKLLNPQKAVERKTVGIRQLTRTTRNARNNRSALHMQQQAQDDLAGILCGFLNCETSTARASAVSRHAALTAGKRKSLMTVQSGKRGQWRGETQGKRVDFSARTTAAPTVALCPFEVGVPHVFSRTLTQDTRVQGYNIEALRERVREGAASLQGAVRVVLRSGVEVALDKLDEPQREVLAVELVPGMRVVHPMADGEQLIINRQPTLRRASMMAHRVRHE